MLVIVKPGTDAFNVDVMSFLDSLTWLYLRHRYPEVAQGNLLRVLTLSGLNPRNWEGYAAGMIIRRPDHRVMRELSVPAVDKRDEEKLRQAVESIWTYAATADAPLGEPPLTPIYLKAYGYNRSVYLADIQLVYGRKIAERYRVPWAGTTHAVQRPVVQPGFLLRPAVAMMGATAGAIEHLIETGAKSGQREE